MNVPAFGAQSARECGGWIVAVMRFRGTRERWPSEQDVPAAASRGEAAQVRHHVVDRLGRVVVGKALGPGKDNDDQLRAAPVLGRGREHLGAGVACALGRDRNREVNQLVENE